MATFELVQKKEVSVQKLESVPLLFLQNEYTCVLSTKNNRQRHSTDI